MKEEEFLNVMCDQTGCSLLLDINNIYVNSKNHNFDPYLYIDHINSAYIKEIHLAGHSIINLKGVEYRIDTHDDFICKEVWDLYKYTIETKGNFLTLIEWDQKIPSLNTLLDEAKKAKNISGVIKNAA